MVIHSPDAQASWSQDPRTPSGSPTRKQGSCGRKFEQKQNNVLCNDSNTLLPPSRLYIIFYLFEPYIERASSFSGLFARCLTARTRPRLEPGMRPRSSHGRQDHSYTAITASSQDLHCWAAGVGSQSPGKMMWDVCSLGRFFYTVQLHFCWTGWFNNKVTWDLERRR